MRMLMHVKIPHQEFNKSVRDGSVAYKLQQIMEYIKPEAVYFTEYSGRRGAIMIVNVKNESDVPGLAEPWFLLFNADVRFHIVMNPDDLAKSGLDEIAKKWNS